jgi:hypothetical protein
MYDRPQARRGEVCTTECSSSGILKRGAGITTYFYILQGWGSGLHWNYRPIHSLRLGRPDSTHGVIHTRRCLPWYGPDSSSSAASFGPYLHPPGMRAADESSPSTARGWSPSMETPYEVDGDTVAVWNRGGRGTAVPFWNRRRRAGGCA